MGYAMFAVTALVIGGVCAYYLYEAARREKRSPVLWGVLGFLFNVFALIAFRLIAGPVVKHRR
jgi:hypothetical protein